MPAPQVTGPSWRIARLGRTPVKGMAHPDLPNLDLTPSGPLHDRVFCLAGADGEVVRTVRDDILMACRAVWKPPVLMIQTPIGDATGVAAGGVALAGSYWGRPVELMALDGPWSPLLSRYLGRPVSLCRVSAAGGVVWSGSVSVVTTSSVAEVARRIGRSPDDGARFRSTVVVDTGTAAPFVEDGWLGQRLRIGSAVIRVAGRMARCAVVDRRPGSGGRDADVLAALTPDRVDGGEILFGVQGSVVTPGRVAVGDAVVLGDRQGGATR